LGKITRFPYENSTLSIHGFRMDTTWQRSSTAVAQVTKQGGAIIAKGSELRDN